MILGVIGGFVAWTMIWLGANAALRTAGLLPPADAAPPTGGLVLLIIVSVVASGVAGAISSRLSGRRATAVLAGVLLVVGVAVEFSLGRLLPLWYHLVFLALLIPATLAGAAMMPRPRN